MRKSQLNRSILIVRLGTRSDIVLASPLAKILKKHNPKAHIAWAVSSECTSFLDANPYIDQIIPVDVQHWESLIKRRQYLDLWRSCSTLRSELSALKFEEAYDLQGTFMSGLVTWLSKASNRVGMGSKDMAALFVQRVISRNIANRDQMGSDYRYLVNQLGYSDSEWRIEIPSNAETQAKAQTLQEQFGIGNDPYIVICPFTTSKARRWKDDYWQQLILRVRGRYQHKAIILGGTHETEEAKQLAQLCGAVSLAGHTDILVAAELIKRASTVIGTDNALTHIAHSLTVPSIALFGPSRPYIYGDNENSKVLFRDVSCAPCQNKPTCKEAYQCMADITPERVLMELKPLIKTNLIFSDKLTA